MFFYSTPVKGSFTELIQYSGSGSWGFEGGEGGDFMSCLQLMDDETSRKTHEFAQLRKKYGWKTAGVVESNETMFTGLYPTNRGPFVTEASARAEFLVTLNVLPNTDHFTIRRPEEETSNSFLHPVEFVRRILG